MIFAPITREALADNPDKLARLAARARDAIAKHGERVMINEPIRGYWGWRQGDVKALWESRGGPKGRITGDYMPGILAVMFRASEVLADCEERLRELEEDKC